MANAIASSQEWINIDFLNIRLISITGDNIFPRYIKASFIYRDSDSIHAELSWFNSAKIYSRQLYSFRQPNIPKIHI